MHACQNCCLTPRTTNSAYLPEILGEWVAARTGEWNPRTLIPRPLSKPPGQTIPCSLTYRMQSRHVCVCGGGGVVACVRACVCVCVYARACVRACVRAYVRACVRVHVWLVGCVAGGGGGLRAWSECPTCATGASEAGD